MIPFQTLVAPDVIIDTPAIQDPTSFAVFMYVAVVDLLENVSPYRPEERLYQPAMNIVRNIAPNLRFLFYALSTILCVKIIKQVVARPIPPFIRTWILTDESDVFMPTKYLVGMDVLLHVAGLEPATSPKEKADYESAAFDHSAIHARSPHAGNAYHDVTLEPVHQSLKGIEPLPPRIGNACSIL